MPIPDKREYYSRSEVAESYYHFSFGGRSGQWVEEREADLLLALIGPAKSVLDLGCGEGRLLRRLSGRGRVVGGDVSLAMLKIAQRQGTPAVVGTDAFRLAFADKSFDCVVCSRLFLHYANPENILREISRVLSDDGWVVFDTFRWSPRTWLPALSASYDGPLFMNPPDRFQHQLAREGWVVLARKGCFLLPPLICRYLPFGLVKILAALETICPDHVFIKDYWKAGKQSWAGEAKSIALP
jgi:SAM-dependent methyltransferase